MKNIHTLDAIRALDGRNFAMLNEEELAATNNIRALSPLEAKI